MVNISILKHTAIGLHSLSGTDRSTHNGISVVVSSTAS